MKAESTWSRFRRQSRFNLERLLVRGPQYRLLAVVLLLAVVAVVGGSVAALSPYDDFKTLGDAVWWALLRLTDPGYLGDEELPWLRFVALILSVAGLAVFVGGLIAVISQWLNDRLEHLSLGLTPLRGSGHIVVLGWTGRSVAIAESLLLARGPAAVDRIAMLVDRVTHERNHALQQALGKRAFNNIVLRTGDPTLLESLERVDVPNARAIIIPGRDVSDDHIESQDARLLHVIANLSAMAPDETGRRPLLTAEMFDERLVPVASDMYPDETLIVSTDTLVAGALALGVTAPGLSFLFADMLDARDGVTLALVRYPELVGQPLLSAALRLPEAVVLGLMGDSGDASKAVCFDTDAIIGAGDRIVIAANVDRPPELREPPTARDVADPHVGPLESFREDLRLLIVGWNGRVPYLLAELSRHGAVEVSADIVSATAIDMRERELAASGAPHFEVRQHSGALAAPETYDQLDLARFNRIVIMGGDVDVGRDSRSIAAYMVVVHALKRTGTAPHIVVEASHSDDEAFLSGPDVEVVDTTSVVADCLAGVVLHPELAMMFRRMIDRQLGAVATAPLGELACGSGTIDPMALERRLRRERATLLGIQRAAGDRRVELALDKREPLAVAPGDRAILFRDLDVPTHAG